MSPLVGVIHYVAFLLVLSPLADFVANVAPFHPSDAHWRYGTVALFSGFLLTPLLGVVMSTVAAELLMQSRVQRVLGFLSLAAGVLLGLSLVLYVLDLLEVRHAVPDDARLTFDVGSLKALGKHVSVVPALLWLGLVNMRLA